MLLLCLTTCRMLGKAHPDGHPGWVDWNSGPNFTVRRNLLGEEALASLGHSVIITKFSGGITIYHPRHKRPKKLTVDGSKLWSCFLLLMCYVPRVVKEEYMRSVKEVWILMTDDRPMTDLRDPFTHFGKISNGHNSATCHPIDFVFGSMVRFSGTANRSVPFLVGSNPRWRLAAIWKSSNALFDSLWVRTHTILCPRTL